MPSPELRTDRLVLTRFAPADAEAFLRYRADPAVRRFQSWAPGSAQEAAAFVEAQAVAEFDVRGTWFQFALRTLEADRLVGDLGVHFLDDGQQVEIGFSIAPGEQRRGYGTEAVRGLLVHLFEERRKHRVSATVDPRNTPSIALLERLGLRREAHFRRSTWTGSEWADDLVYAVLRSEWRPPGAPRA